MERERGRQACILATWCVRCTCVGVCVWRPLGGSSVHLISSFIQGTLHASGTLQTRSANVYVPCERIGYHHILVLYITCI